MSGDEAVPREGGYEEAIESRLAQLSLAQQVRLLTGADVWSLHAEPAIGLSRVVVSDGPTGVRGEVWDERDPSLSLPSATALAATWDPDLAYRYGAALAAEARRKGVHVVLGPTINLHRSPLGGRHFESYSEDPELTALIAAAYVRGLQEHGVAACPKHYVANDAETERWTVSVEVSERALRELYLIPFERVVRAGAWAVMSAYNSVNGVTMTEHELLDVPLCREWGFDGVVISDWGAVRSVAAARARQDLAMPGPEGPWAEGLLAAVEDGEVPPAEIEEKTRRILRLAARTGNLTGVPGAASEPLAPEAGPALAREIAAAGTVCVRNTLLPLVGPRRIAVLGQSADLARIQGGGSATVVPERTLTPLAGIREAFPDAEVVHCIGAEVRDGIVPLPLAAMRHPDGEPGLRARFRDAEGRVVLDEHRRSSALVWLGNAPEAAVVLELTADLELPPGRVELGALAGGPLRIDVDGQELLTADQPLDAEEAGSALLYPPEASVEVELTGPVRLHVTYEFGRIPGRPRGLAAITLGWRMVRPPEELIAEATAAARDADVAIVVVGTSSEVESEGFDRRSLALPGYQDELVAAVAAANPRTVVVVNAGAPVLMPWRHEVGAILLTWFAGQEYGAALGDVLSGALEPGGRLPTTWPGADADVPVLVTTPDAGVLRYQEGIHIGYRAWQRLDRAPAYPFGFGLGYTSWSYQELTTADQPDGGAQVTVWLANTGQRRGKEVVQVYLSRPESGVERPSRWLVGAAVVTADPGEQVQAEVVLSPRAFAHWDGGWVVEPGAYQVIVGRHADAVELVATLVR